eukprot:SAG11_NODE_1387_length_5065_cov_12.530099_4_plen_157_part_00
MNTQGLIRARLVTVTSTTTFSPCAICNVGRRLVFFYLIGITQFSVRLRCSTTIASICARHFATHTQIFAHPRLELFNLPESLFGALFPFYLALCQPLLKVDCPAQRLTAQQEALAHLQTCSMKDAWVKLTKKSVDYDCTLPAIPPTSLLQNPAEMC